MTALMAEPELRVPDLPHTAKVRDKALRTGWTTGACSAAAAKAAALLLRGDAAPATVDIPLPQPFRGSDRATFAVDRSGVARDRSWAEGVVVKDAGDDPDVTHGAHLTVRLERLPAGDVDFAAGAVVFAAGDGVGTVTKPGLGLDVGGPAINPVPRRMITAAIREAIDDPVRCTISVPNGDNMARKTTNTRLGIVGGISILGTTGVVRPFSTASWHASVVQAVDVLAAQGLDTVVLATGGRTERAAIELLPGLPDTCFIEVGDFTGAALQRAVERGVPDVVFVGMAGKLAKLAAGVFMTHYTRSKVDTDVLARITRDAGGDDATVAAVYDANTARHAVELWADAGLRRAPSLVCDAVKSNIERFTDGAITARVVMVDFESLQPVGEAK